MTRWLRLWMGHILLGLLVVAFLFGLLFARNSMAGVNADEMWWNFVCAALCFLLTVVLGIMATWTYKTHRDRYYMRRLWHHEDTNESGVPTGTDSEFSRAYGAHSAREGVSTDAE